MAKYVLLVFDDDAAADKAVQMIQGAHGLLWLHDQQMSCDVRGVYKKPTKFCRCVGVKGRAFTRGQKYGWWVCSKCKKPTIGWGRGDHWFLALGRNLLPVDGNAPEYRGDGVFGHFHNRQCEACGTALKTEVGHAQTKVWCPKCEEWR